MKEAPKDLLGSAYRKTSWKNAKEVLKKIEKVLPITSAHLLGSFTTKKKRPADVDLILLLQTTKGKGEEWSLDIVIAPEGNHGQFVLDDAEKWMKQKYGSKKSKFLKLK